MERRAAGASRLLLPEPVRLLQGVPRLRVERGLPICEGSESESRTPAFPPLLVLRLDPISKPSESQDCGSLAALRALAVARLLRRVGAEGAELSAASSRWMGMELACVLDLVARRRVDTEASAPEALDR